MASKFEEFMLDRYSAYPLMLAVSSVIPGQLLNAEWSSGHLWSIGRDRHPTFTLNDGLAWDLLKIPGDSYESELVPASIIQQSVNEKRTFGGSVSLPQFGVSLSGQLDREYQAVLRIQEVRARVFKNSRAPFELMQKLLAIKETDRDLWDWVNDDFLVVEAYCVTKLIAEFKSEGAVSAKAAFERAGQKMDVAVRANWLTENTLELVGEPSVPAAVRGLKV